MHVAEIELCEILREKVGDKEAKTLVEYIEAKIDKTFDEKISVFATKEDLANLKTDLMVEIEKTRSDIIKWMFLFWIGQLASLIALLRIFFRK
jgi:hypothetical protein